MLKKSQRLKTIVDIKATQEKKLLEALGIAQKRVLAAKAQVDNLRKYQQEYQDGFSQKSAQGVTPMQVLEFRSFMSKLDQAIEGQENSLTECEVDLRLKRSGWENMHQRTQSLQKVCDSALASEVKLENKLEQLAQDERAGRLGRSSATGM